MNKLFSQTPVSMRHFLLSVCLLTVAGMNRVGAHSVWIEPGEAGPLWVRFAEPGNHFEKSPGHLDELALPSAFQIVTNSPALVDVVKKSDGFLLVDTSATNVVCAETSFIVRGGRKPIFYARWQPAGGATTRPLLTLDLVPTGKPGEVRAYFRGQPLGGIQATLRSPDEKEIELTADGEGFLRFKPEQSGLYMLIIAHHRESLAGVHNGRPYEQTSHNAALTWRQP